MIVIVRQQVGERHILLPGIVFSTAGDKTYIAAEDPHLLENPDLDVKRMGQATIVWGAAGEHNGIPAKRLGLLVKRQKWIYEAAADKLPRPLPAPKPAEKAIGPVSLVGFTLFPEEFTPLASTGSCQRTRDTTLNRDELRVQISTKPGFSGVLLISEKLGPVGFGLFPGITYDGLTLICLLYTSPSPRDS